MITICFDQDNEIKSWASEKLENICFGESAILSMRQDDKLIAAIIYNNFFTSPKGDPISIEMSIASISPLWCSRSHMYSIFAYPFIQLSLKRVQATCSENNVNVRNFLDRVGFTLEGIGREAWTHGGNCAVYSMLKNECKWLNYVNARKRK